MKKAIDRGELLDPWHLTQVLLANSPLTKDVLLHLESSQLLNAFFMSFLYDVVETGTANYRKLLEYEISSREADRQNALTALTRYYNENSDQVDHTEDIKALMMADNSEYAKLWLLDYYLEMASSSEAGDLIDDIASWKGMGDYASFKQMQLTLDNDWTNASLGQLSTLESWASNPLSSAFGQATSVLRTLVLTDLLPEPELPFEERSVIAETHRERSVYVPELSAYPNPAQGHSFITYPAEADGLGVINVYNELGQMCSSLPLNGKGIVELNTSALSSGVYLISLVFDGSVVTSEKLIVN